MKHDLTKHCTNCNTEGQTASIMKRVDKKYNGGKEMHIYLCYKCKAISKYIDNVLVSVE